MRTGVVLVALLLAALILAPLGWIVMDSLTHGVMYP
jgi:hypothetical protein